MTSPMPITGLKSACERGGSCTSQMRMRTGYQDWDTYQQLHLQAVAPLSDEPLAFHAAPHVRLIREPLRAHDRRAPGGFTLFWGRVMMSAGDDSPWLPRQGLLE